jgi:hypothetical protein
MSGDTEKASIWGDADVYVTDDLDAPIPDTIQDAFNESWDLVGLLDGDAGFEEERSEDTSDKYAWGSILVRTQRSNFSLTRKFTALEDNPVVNGLLWPGSTATKRRVPRRHKFKIAFHTRDGIKEKRVISTLYAEVSNVGTIKDSETDLTKYEITVKIYPTAEGDLFDVQGDEQAAGTLLAVALNPATKAVKVGEYSAPLVATATYSDGTTRNVSHLVTWGTLAAAKATVDHGYVHGVAVGTAKITATLRGQSAVCDVTVSAA